MNWFEYVLGAEWEVYPAGGATGDAYFAQFNNKKLFLKRNSSPFLAVLSAEGIVPKLIWTKRLENGDVITAQHWISGRELKPVDMYGKNVAELLYKIHNSSELLDMLKRLGKKEILPEEVLRDIKIALSHNKELNAMRVFEIAVQFLEKEQNNVQTNHHVVCHSDVNHNNWLMAENDELFLIDWDGAMIADPAIDLGMLLHWYIKKEDWSTWLSLYGIELTDHLVLRMKWYFVAQTVLSIIWYNSKDKQKEVNYWIQYLENIL